MKSFDRESFIYELLLAYGSPKASITRSQKGNLNLSKNESEIIWKKKLFFKEEYKEDLHITDEDEEAGYIYVLKSKSKDERITSIKDLFKIGYATNIEERLKGAEKQPTYLMAPVDYVAGWKCYNMNPQKFEQLIHNFFGNSCLEVDVFDSSGKRYTPREWFIAPIEVIEQAIELIINGKITKCKYDVENKTIIER